MRWYMPVSKPGARLLPRGDWGLFRQRLSWDGLNEESVRSILGVVSIPDDAPLPAWTEMLCEY